MRMKNSVVALAITGSLTLSGAASATGYEVWVSDQTNSAGISGTNNTGTHGGFLRVFDGAALDFDPNTATSTNLDTAVLWSNALTGTGSNTATPMRIVAMWDKSKISAAGCGAAESGGYTWLNAGVYVSNVASFVVYRMPTN